MKLSLSIAAALPALALSLTPTRVSEFDLKHAAVTSIAPSYANDGECSLLVTTFYPFGDDSVNVISNPMTKPSIDVIDAKAKWPNQADPISSEESKKLGISRGILSANGFFVSPTKSTGAVTLYDTSDSSNVTATKISTDKKGYFYHHAEFSEIDGDSSTIDVVAARAYKSSFNPFGKPDGELVWIKQSGDAWTEQVLAKGPGVAFVQDDLDGDGKVEFIAAQFFLKQQLAVYSCDGNTWAECASNQSLVRTTVVDNDSDIPFFNVQVYDLNGDGKKDLLATTNTANGKGSVLAYEQPPGGEWRQGSWPKHRIATGFKPTKAFLPGRGSPGTATAFHVTKDASGKAQVIVSADDGGFVSLLTTFL